MKTNLSHSTKIAVIGNSCGGKTVLSRHLQKKTQIPLIHVDQVQFLPGLKFRPYSESIEILKLEQQKSYWIIDGYGPLDILEQRLALADLIIMIDLPIRIHYLWALKRVIKNIFFAQRSELPRNSSERNFKHILKLFKTIYQIHTKMRPEMLRILSRDQFKNKVLFIRTTKDLDFYRSLEK
jgi:adenylate kinase family enzyme